MSTTPTTTPDGYEVGPSASDHMLKLAIPVPGRDPIKVAMPRRDWMSPAEVKAFSDWITPLNTKQQKWFEWETANNTLPPAERAEPPFPEDAFPDLSVRTLTLQWMKPYLSETDYSDLLEKAPDGTISWLSDKILNQGAGATVGESSASTDS